MTHDELQSLLGAYALDALDPEEVVEVEEHLTQCPRCRAEVASHRKVALYLAAAEGEAPAGVWNRIATELALDVPGAEPVPDLHAGRPVERARLVPRRSRHRAALPFVAAVATAAAAAAAVLGVTASHLDHRVNVLSHTVGTGGLQQAAAAAVLNPHHQNVQLASANHRQTAQVVILPDGNAYLVRSDLPALSALRTYQLWGLANGKVVSLGLLGTHPQLVAFRVEHGITRLMVTAEPRGGSPEPTLPVLVQGNLPA